MTDKINETDATPAVSGGFAEMMLGIAAAGARPYHKKFALERLAQIKTDLLDAIDGGDECRGRDTWLSDLVRDIEYVEGQIKAIQ